MNPIEMDFTRLSNLLRKAAARSQKAICDTIGRLIEGYSANECANCLEHSG